MQRRGTWAQMAFLTPRVKSPLCDPQLHEHPPSQQLHTWLLLLLEGLPHPQDLESLKGIDHAFVALSPAPGKVPGTDVSKMLEGWDEIGWMEEQTLHIVVLLRFRRETSPNHFEPQSHPWLLYLQVFLFKMTETPGTACNELWHE